jgi:hypothetical protein
MTNEKGFVTRSLFKLLPTVKSRGQEQEKKEKGGCELREMIKTSVTHLEGP